MPDPNHVSENEELNESSIQEEPNALDQSFAEAPEEDAQSRAFQWWDHLQKALDSAGCELDLTVPEDTIRLLEFDIEKLDVDEYSMTPHYALDPTHRTMDVMTITEQDALSRQRNTLLPPETILRMYEYAREGRLIVQTHNKAAVHAGPRQVLVDENGLPYVGNDFLHPTEFDEKVSQLMDPPQPPVEPDQKTRDLARKGDRKAQFDVENYAEDLDVYNRNNALWNEIQQLKAEQPEHFQQSINLTLIVQQYFQTPFEFGTALVNYSAMTTAAHTRYADSKLPPEELAFRKDEDAQAARISELYSQMRREFEAHMEPDTPLTARMLDQLAELFTCHRVSQEDAQILQNKQAAEKKPRSAAEMEAEVSTLRRSEAFRNGSSYLTWADVESFIFADPDKRMGKLEKLEDIVRQNEANPPVLPKVEPPKPIVPPELPEPRVQLIQTGRTLFRLGTELKSETKWYSLNSQAYGDLCTALEQLNETYRQIDGFVDMKQAEELQEQLRSVDALARAYQAHIGVQGKNARQQNRLDITNQVLALTGVLLEDDAHYQAVIDKHNTDIAKAYYQDDVRDFDKQKPDEPEADHFLRRVPDEMIREKEESFQKGLARTDALRQELEALQQLEAPTRAEAFCLKRDAEILEAREALTQMVGRRELNPDKIKPLLVTMLVGTECKMFFRNDKGAETFYQMLREDMLTHPVFDRMVRNFKSDDLNDVLDGPGEKRFMDRYQQAKLSYVAPARPENAGRENPSRQEERSVKNEKTYSAKIP